MNIFDTEIRPINAVSSVSRAKFDSEIRPAGEPIILRGLVKNWPAVKAGITSIQEMGDYIKKMDSHQPVPTYLGPSHIQGRYFYSDDMKTFNFERRNIPLSVSIDKLLQQKDSPEPIGIYAGATSTVDVLKGFGAFNPMPLVGSDVPPLIWLGNSARIAPHFDTSENIACCVAGTRRFLVFPPSQIENLYGGPIDHNMAGPPASLVDPKAIDLEKFPKFELAMSFAKLAELQPGDALYMPSLWWHYVESEGPLNVLVNYWWSSLKNNAPMSNIALALLTLRDLPSAERAAWQHYFNHYIFNPKADQALDHVPESLRGVLGKKSPNRDQRIKQFLVSRLQQLLR
jgi:hypothetical protein